MIAESIVGGVALGHLLVAPFTKVEESFNMQACHDLLYHGPYLSQYDHLEYPGVVPRSFLGPMMLSSLALPFVTVAKILGISKFYSQYIVRIMLGLLVMAAWRRFYGQVKRTFGVGVAAWFTAITVTQFHFMYYLSRTLPNTFALVFALLACSYWLEQNHWMFVVASGIGIAVFRIDLMLMLAPMLLHDLYSNRIHWTRLLWWVASVGAAVLVVTVALDSLLWGRLLWPEGEVFWFNTARNQSHLWGTLPLLWYWYSALPRALGASYFLVPLGLFLDERMRLLTGPAFALVGLYSLLPHKELRFIIYALPLLNVAAASACQHIWRHCRRNAWWTALCCGAVMHLLVNCTLTALLLTVSAANYPGGAALVRLQQLVPASSRVSVHIDNLAAQSGVTRFLQLNEGWIYNKTEELRAGGPELRSFTHLLVEAKTKYAYNLKHYTNSHNIIDAVEAFSHLSFNYQHFPPVKIRMKPAMYLLENLIDEDIRWEDDEVTEAEESDADSPPVQGLVKEQKSVAEPVESPLEGGETEEPVSKTTSTDNKKRASKKKKKKVVEDQSLEESVVEVLDDSVKKDKRGDSPAEEAVIQVRDEEKQPANQTTTSKKK